MPRLEKIAYGSGFIVLGLLTWVGHAIPSSAADQSPAITVLAAAATSDVPAVELRNGEAVPVGSRFQVRLGTLEHAPLTVKAISSVP
jgi:hypothetical protein